MGLKININSKLDELRIENGFIKPAYLNRLNFGFIPSTIKSLFQLPTNIPTILESELVTKNKYSQIAVLFIDNMGWYFIDKYKKYFEFLSKYDHKVSKITSQFPSTTVAHVTTMNTGLPVYDHGMYEWFMYHDVIDSSISPFLLNRPLDKINESLLEDFNISDILPKANFYNDLSLGGLTSAQYLPIQFTDTMYNKYT